jgi:hypothetical protein
MTETGGAGSAAFPDLLNQFRHEIAAVGDRVDGRREPTYGYFLRFKVVAVS